jgi:hypothetical protein
MHAVKVAITNDKNNILGPVRIFYDVIHTKYTQNKWHYIPFRNAAKARTIETPLRLSPPVRLFQEALMIIASVPDVRGAEKTAYALVPFRV